MAFKGKDTKSDADFKSDNRRGNVVEDHIEALLQRIGADYTRHTLPPYGDPGYWDALKVQHTGDFNLNKTNVKIEVKLDERAKQYGNLFVELAEVYEEDAHIKIVGPLKHLKHPTVFVQAIGPVEDRSYFVYTAEDFYRLLKDDFSLAKFTFKSTNDSKDMKFKKTKYKLSLLIKNFDTVLKSDEFAQVFTYAETDEELIAAIKEKAIRAAKVTHDGEPTHDVFWSVVMEMNQQWNFHDNGWNVYQTTFGGEKFVKKEIPEPKQYRTVEPIGLREVEIGELEFEF